MSCKQNGQDSKTFDAQNNVNSESINQSIDHKVFLANIEK